MTVWSGRRGGDVFQRLEWSNEDLVLDVVQVREDEILFVCEGCTFQNGRLFWNDGNEPFSLRVSFISRV